jgi:hypothetical protein
MSDPSPSRREAGSAYIMALLVLVVLSIMGLALALISQTELQIGSNELAVHRVLYGAESGFGVNLSRYLTKNTSVESVSADGTAGAIDPQLELFELTLSEVRYDVDAAGVITELASVPLDQRVTVSPLVPIRETCCDMCPCAEGDTQLVSVNNAIVSTSERLANVDTAGEQVLARKQLFKMIGVQPWWKPSWEAIADDEAMQEIVQETYGDFSESHP